MSSDHVIFDQRTDANFDENEKSTVRTNEHPLHVPGKPIESTAQSRREIGSEHPGGKKVKM